MAEEKLRLRDLEKYCLHYIFLPAVYFFYIGRAVQEKLVLFADAKNDKLPFDMQIMYENMERQGYKVENWCVDFDKLSLRDKVEYLLQFMKRYAQAKYVFLCDYFLPVYSCSKRKETKVIQLWHSCGVPKKFGYDAEDDLGARAALQATKNIDLWPVSAEICVPVFEQASRLYCGTVKALGVSRTDIYFSEDYSSRCTERFYNAYPELRGKKIILWAPTFRGNAKSATLTGAEDIKKLQDALGDDWKIIIKVHPHLTEKYNLDNCTFPTEQLYPVIDLLITDYSSVIFDYSLFGKPFLIYVPDYEEYMQRRGCYIDLEREVPCGIIKEFEELKERIVNERFFSATQGEEFREKYMYCCNGGSTLRILECLDHMTC